MGLSRPRPVRTRPGLIGLAAGVVDPGASRAIAEVERAIGLIERRAFQPVVLTGVDLALGTNKLDHGLGRPVVGAIVVPTALGGDWRVDVVNNPHAARQVWIEISGVAQPGATVVVF